VELGNDYRISVRKACRLLGISRSSFHYRSCRQDDSALRGCLKDLAFSRPRYGYRRLHILLRRQGWQVNVKRIWRLYKEENLMLRTKRRKKRASHLRAAPPPPERRNERWAIDFMTDRLTNGERLRIFTGVDIKTRECVALGAAHRMPSTAVTAMLDHAIEERGKPEIITLDNGTEFTSNHFDQWAYQRGIHLDFVAPGRPMDNGFIESFNGSLRDEFLQLHWFETLEQARKLLSIWREEYNEIRPHSSLGGNAPNEYVARLLSWFRPP